MGIVGLTSSRKACSAMRYQESIVEVKRKRAKLLSSLRVYDKLYGGARDANYHSDCALRREEEEEREGIRVSADTHAELQSHSAHSALTAPDRAGVLQWPESCHTVTSKYYVIKSTDKPYSDSIDELMTS